MIGYAVPKESTKLGLPYEGIEGIDYTMRGSRTDSGKIWDTLSVKKLT